MTLRYRSFTDWSSREPKIERSYMDGSHREKLVHTSIVWPNAVTIDHDQNMLCWADAGLDTIETMHLKSGRRDVLINEKAYSGVFLHHHVYTL